jgi:hypothetical protein
VRWITRRNLHIDRTACPWLICRFIDPQAEFVFVPASADPASLDGHTFDMRGAEFSHSEGKCTFEVMLDHYHLVEDRSLVEMGRIIRDADVPPRRTRRAESAGIDALLRGIQLTVPDDYEKLRITRPFYEGLYAYCQAKVAAQPPSTGTARPRLRSTQRVRLHLQEDS